MSKQDYVTDRIAQIIGGQNARTSAELIVDMLREEGLLHLGYGNTDIDIVVNKFADTFGTTKVSRYDRFAAGRLVAKHGSQSIVVIIDLLAKHQTEKYVPVVRSVADLETKWTSVVHFLRNTGMGSETIKL